MDECPTCSRRTRGSVLCEWCGRSLDAERSYKAPRRGRTITAWFLDRVIPLVLTGGVTVAVLVTITAGRSQAIRPLATPSTTPAATQSGTATRAPPTPTLTPTATPVLLDTPTRPSRPVVTPAPTVTPQPTPTSPPPLTSTATLTPTWLSRPFTTTTEDVETVAYIVGGEANAMPYEAQLMVACQVWADVAEGMPVHALHNRWYGHQHPTESAWNATVWGLLSVGCDSVPRCRFVLNLADVHTLLGLGMLTPDMLGEGGGRFWVNERGDMLYCVPR